MKIKRKIISILTAIMLFVNVPLMGFIEVYADDALVTQNPLFIPITSLVTAVALGSGIIAKNSADAITAGNQLVNNVINNIKSSEVQKIQEDANYDSPYRVINGGQPEKPNNDNKNGTWVALGGGAIASNELWANKDTVIDIMKQINDVGGYNQMQANIGVVSSEGLISNGSASNIALQLANISNSAVTQFDQFLHSSFWDNLEFTPDDCFFQCNVSIADILQANPMYPRIYLRIYKKSDDLKKLSIQGNPFSYYTFSNNYGTLSYYYANSVNGMAYFQNDDNVSLNLKSCTLRINARSGEANFTYSNASNWSDYNGFYTSNGNIGGNQNYAYCGYKWAFQSPFQFTNNVYNVNMQFDENFQNWIQGQIQLLGQGLMDAVKLGITTSTPTWNPTQEQIQTGVTPASVIYQYINNYENPENIPDDEPSVDPDPDPNPEPEPEPEPATENMVDEASQSLFDWALSKITLPDGIWEKIPFSIPYDTYLLIKAILPSRTRQRKLLTASLNSVDNPNGITISSHYDASGADVRSNQAVFEVPAKWSQNAPVINWDLHFTYSDVSGQTKTLDYVKTVDLAEYAYFAMIIYIGIYVSWMGTILGFIFDSFK